MTSDSELLERYARLGSQDAFAELVNRHLNLVYSAALRQVNGDAHLAQDVAQTVFADLARKAKQLSRRTTITGWLYTSAHFAAAKVVRTENRRRDREETFMREPIHETAPETDWKQIRPTLDKAMHDLKEADREAILLRYFENRQFAEVGAKLGLNENAARMRVERALEKLRAILAQGGITASAGLSAAISTNAVQLAPAGLAATLTTTSLALAGTGTTITALNILTMTKLKLALSAIAVAGIATTLVIQHETQTKLDIENQALRQQMGLLQNDNERLSNLVAQANSVQPQSDDQLLELVRLRGEVRLLRTLTNEVGIVRAENRRLQSQLDQLRAAQANRTKAPQPSEDPATEQQPTFAMMKMNNSKQFALAMLLFSEDNNHQFPTNFDQTVPYLSVDQNAPFLTNFNQIEILYQGAWTNITRPATTIISRDNQAWMYNGKWAKAYAFGDGHVEIHTEPDGNFEAWEHEHMIQPPTNQ